MKKFASLFVALLFLPNLAVADNHNINRPMDACRVEAPYGFPTGKQGIGLCRQAYATVNDINAKLPIWTVWTITPEEAIGCNPRENAFVPDPNLPPGKRATPDDYAGTGYDRGHVAPDGDMAFSRPTSLESFYMSNMMPQSGGLNRGIWKLLETHIRGWVVQRNTSITVYSGPIYSMTDPKIGNNQVVVPHAFYKIVIDNKTREVLAFIFPHKNDLGKDIQVAQSTVSEVERRTGLKFPLPQNPVLNKTTRDYTVDFGALTKAKQAKCKG